MESIWSIAESAKTSAILHPGPRNDSQHIQGLQQQVACKIRILRCLRYRMSWDHVRNHHPLPKKRIKTRRTKSILEFPWISHVPSPPEPPADVPCWPRWGPAGPALRNLTSRSLAAGQCLGRTLMKTPSMGLHQNRAVTNIPHGFFWAFSMGRIIIQDTWTTQKFEIRKRTWKWNKIWKTHVNQVLSWWRFKSQDSGHPPRHFSAKAPSIPSGWPGDVHLLTSSCKICKEDENVGHACQELNMFLKSSNLFDMYIYIILCLLYKL